MNQRDQKKRAKKASLKQRKKESGKGEVERGVPILLIVLILMLRLYGIVESKKQQARIEKLEE